MVANSVVTVLVSRTKKTGKYGTATTTYDRFDYSSFKRPIGQRERLFLEQAGKPVDLYWVTIPSLDKEIMLANDCILNGVEHSIKSKLQHEGTALSHLKVQKKEYKND